MIELIMLGKPHEYNGKPIAYNGQIMKWKRIQGMLTSTGYKGRYAIAVYEKGRRGWIAIKPMELRIKTK